MNSRINIPRIIVAGTASGVGKTTIALALMQALVKTGDKVQPFKAGPDYIDPGYHTAVTGRISRNLDTHLLSNEAIAEVFGHAAIDADIAVVEGVMGLYDGAAGGDGGTTASLAKVIGAPVILVIDCAGAGQSIAAVAAGFRAYDPDLRLAGVILNQVGSERHLEIIKEALDGVGIPTLGWLKRDKSIRFEERHLGLVPYGEKSGAAAAGRLRAVAIEGFEPLKIRRIAADVRPFAYKNELFLDAPSRQIRVGIARDKAFNFYYQDNLDILEKAGAELVQFSPLTDDHLPASIDGLYLGGGFPEMFADDLSENYPMLRAVRDAVDNDLPTYAECGGLIYLTKGLSNENGEFKELCGAIDAVSRFTPFLKSLGYRRGRILSDNLLAVKGAAVKGHEFHYCDLIEVDNATPRAYMIEKSGTKNYKEGFARGDLLASFLHIHFGSDRGWAERFIERAAKKSKEAV